jgi:oligoendopeptidase F
MKSKLVAYRGIQWSLVLALLVLSASPLLAKDRSEIEDSAKWDVSHIYSSFDEWNAAYSDLENMIGETEAMKGTLSEGADQLLRYYQLQDQAGKKAYKVWYYVNLQRDVDLRDNTMNANRQRVQSLFAKWNTATSWFTPELLQIPLDQVKSWMNQNKDLAVYRFAIEEQYRQQEHVLDAEGERLLSLNSQFNSSPADIYSMLATADTEPKTVTLSDGEELEVTTGQYYARLQTERNQLDREVIWHAFFENYQEKINTYASIYNALCQRDWAVAQARDYDSTLDAALDANAIPTSVVETLIDVTKKGAGPLQRYYELRRRALGLDKISIYDGYVSLVDDEGDYPYDVAKKWVVDAVAPLGKEYQAQLKKGLDNNWVDVFESEGKRTGAYSASVYGVHPYVLLNYSDTMNDVFTLAHEMGHAMHSVLASEHQPFVYSDPTIFVAEVASTLNEGLLLDYMLQRTDDPQKRVLLLQHAIDSIALTYYRQVCFADFELQAHRMVEKGEPITADGLTELYNKLLREYYGPNVELDPLYGITWSRIPHFYRTPYYVYQYATCFASSAKLLEEMHVKDKDEAAKATQRYLHLLSSGGNDHPVALLQAAGVDLTQASTVQAVIDQMDHLVSQLAVELQNIGVSTGR